MICKINNSYLIKPQQSLKCNVRRSDLQNNVAFSICIPVHNRQTVIQRCIDSILTQSFQDFEIVIVDDCSNDKTSQIIQRIPDKRIKYYKNDVNMGSFYSRSLAMYKAIGQYVIPLDSDDTLDRNALKALNEIIKSDPDIGIIQFNINVLRKSNESQQPKTDDLKSYFNIYGVDSFTDVLEMFKYSLDNVKNRNIITKCFKRSDIQQVIDIAYKKYAKTFNISMYDDFLWLCILMAYGRQIKKIQVFPFQLYNYYLGGQSTKQLSYDDKEDINTKKLLNGICEIFKDIHDEEIKRKIHLFMFNDLKGKLALCNLPADAYVRYLYTVCSGMLKIQEQK